MKDAKHLLVGLLIVVAVLAGQQQAHSQTPIVLRDLTVIRNNPIVDFDQTKIQLADGRQLSWDQILQADIELDRQTEFDRNLIQIGLPLFRLRTRVTHRDWSGAAEIAEPMYQSGDFGDLNRIEKTATSYLLCVATMKGRLRQGKRSAAVLPFLQAAKIQIALMSASEANSSTGEPQTGMTQPNQHLSKEDVKILVTPEILPVWFDRQAIEKSFHELSNAFVPNSETKDMGAVVYLASMAIETHRLSLADDLLKLLDSSDEHSAWKILLRAQLAIAKGDFDLAERLIDQNRPTFGGPTDAVASYLRSARYFSIQPIDPRDPINVEADPESAQRDLPQPEFEKSSAAMLELLKVPALYGRHYPELSAASLYQASQIANSLQLPDEEKILTHELLNRFPRTYSAKNVSADREIK